MTLRLRRRPLPLIILCCVLLSGAARADAGVGPTGGAGSAPSRPASSPTATPAVSVTATVTATSSLAATQATPALAPTQLATATQPITPVSMAPTALVTATVAPTQSATPTATSVAATVTPTAAISAAGVVAATPVTGVATSTPDPGPPPADGGTPVTATVATLNAAADLTATADADAGRLPLSFAPNRGQSDSAVRFLAHGPGFTLFLTGADATLTLRAPRARAARERGHASAAPDPSDRPTTPGVAATAPLTPSVVRLRYVGANPAPQVVGEDQLPGVANYLLGADPSRWVTAVPTYARVTYRDLYPGVDLAYYGRAGRLEYDWIIQPGADPTRIGLAIAGTRGLAPDAQGDLLLRTDGGTLLQHAPVAYQEVDGRRQPVAASYVVSGTTVGVAVGRYDASRPLIIDPALLYSTYLGGSGDDLAYGVALDPSGAIYLAGDTGSTDYPTANPEQPGNHGTNGCVGGACDDAVLTKLTPDGRALVYSTYYGGSGSEIADDVRVDSAGDAYLVGDTQSGDLPTTSTAFQRTYGSSNCNPVGTGDAFLAKFAPSGASLLYATYYGGCLSDHGYGLAVDTAGHAYIDGVTYSTNLTTKNAYQATSPGGEHAYVAEFDTTQSGSASLVYATYLRGSGNDIARSLAVDGAGAAYVTGDTTSADFPTTPGAFQTAFGGDDNAFVTKLAPGGAALAYSTYVGRNGEAAGIRLALDGAGGAYVTGDTTATNWITTTGALQPSYGGGYGDGMVFHLDPSGGRLLYSSYLGGNDYDAPDGIAVDAAGTIYVAGTTYSANFPTQGAVQPNLRGVDDAFVTAIGANGALAWSTYLGGGSADGANALALDGAGDVVVTGGTQSSDFPTTPGAYQPSHAATTSGYWDIFLSKLSGRGGGFTPGAIPWHPHSSGVGAIGGGVDLSVDLADGHADVTMKDLSIPGRGPDLALDRAWDSALAGGSGTGLAASVTPGMGGTLAGTVVYTDGTGAVWDFPYVGPQGTSGPYTSYRTPPGQPWQLTTSTAGYTLTDFLTSETWTFDAQGRLLSDADAYGNSDAMSYGAGSATSPSAEANSGGRSLAFAYANGALTDAQSPLWRSSGGAQGQHVTYGYNAGGQLTGRTLGAGTSDAVSTTFGYSGTLLTAITTASGRTWALGYDGQGRVISVTSPASGTAGQPGYTPSYTTQYTYGVTQTTVVAGAGTSGALTTTYTLDAQGEPLTVTNGLGQSSGATYDADHDVTTSADAGGHTTTDAYQYVGPNGAIGQLTQETQPAIQPYSPNNGLQISPVITHTYDPTTHDLVATGQPEGGLTKYTYDGHHGVVATTERTTWASCPTSPCATTWRGAINGYDPYGEVTSATDGRGVSVDGSGHATLNDPSGLYTSHQGYDTQGDLTSASTPPITTTLNNTTTTAPVTTTYTYDGDGNRQTMVSDNGNTTTYGYDHLGRQISATRPSVALYNGTAAPVQATAYDKDGNVARETDGKNDVTAYSYDPLGRLVGETNPVTGTTVLTYTAGEKTAEQDPQGNVTAYGYDAAGRVIGEQDPITGTTSYGYDAAGNTVAITNGDSSGAQQIEQLGYDALDRVITDTTTAPATGTLTTTTRYDLDGNVAQAQQPNGDVTYNTYDQADQLRSVEIDPQPVQPGGLSAAKYESYGYDAAGNVTSFVDADGRATTTQYDGDNRKRQSVDQAAGATGATVITTTLGYDPNGNTVSRSAATQAPAGGVTTDTSMSAYNADDQPTSVTADGYTTTYQYDAADQVRSETTTDGATSVTAGLDAAGRVTSVAENAGGAGPYTSGFGYNADDLPTQVSLPSGVAESASYDKDSQIIGLSISGPSLNATYGYAYNGQGLLTSDTTISGTDAVAHDPATGRLVSDCGPQAEVRNTTDHCYRWTYNGNGDITSQVADNGATQVYTYSQAQPNERLQSTLLQGNVPPADRFRNPDTYYAYDNNGDVTAITSPVNGGYTDTAAVNTHIAYDAQARPVQITHLSHGIPITATLAYGAAGERSRYTVVMSGTTILDEQFRYRGGQLGSVNAMTATLNADGSIKSSGSYQDTYIYGAQGEPLEFLRQQNGQTSRYWYVLDGMGNIVAVTDIHGTVVDRYSYDLWGEATGAISETVPQQLRYRGYWWDGELEWYWLDGRYYDPEDVHFLQPDPTDLDGVHTYVYADADPADLMEVGGAFPTFGEFWHHAVLFLDSAAHVTYKVAAAAWNAVAGDDIHVLCCTSDPLPIKALAGVDLALTVLPGTDAAKLVEVGAKTAAKAGAERGVLDLVRWVMEKTGRKLDVTDDELRAAVEARAKGGQGALRAAEQAAGCALCFPAGTLVATPHGQRAIQGLHAGDAVLAEDPKTGTVEVEAVQATIQDPASPLIAVDLSDGSAITVTADHPFWVDKGAQLASAGWFTAGSLRPGDELRTAGGVDSMVVGLRHNVGHAIVYTLTVATDHTFFVGPARVLVHNANCGLGREIIREFTGNIFQAFGEARADAQKEAQLGADAIDFREEIGPMEGRIVGRHSSDGLRGWRLDWDNSKKELHVNWWDKTGGKRRSTWRYGKNVIVGGTYNDYLYLLSRFPLD